jgi:phosphoserine phosphatase
MFAMMDMMEKPKLIVFDLNKTLIVENSWSVLNNAMGVAQEEDSLLMKWGQEGIISDAQGQAIICAIYQKRANPSRGNIQKILSGYTYSDDARAVVEWLHEKGYKLALLSGSMDILVEKVANELGIELWACNNRFVFDEKEMLHTIETIDNDDRYKANQLQNMCDELDIKPTETMCIGDGDNDALLFGLSGCGVTFKNSHIKNRAKYTINKLDDILKLLA